MTSFTNYFRFLKTLFYSSSETGGGGGVAATALELLGLVLDVDDGVVVVDGRRGFARPVAGFARAGPGTDSMKF
jgi:hypothetical protein